MKAMMNFMRTLFSLPMPIRIWLGLLMFLNMVVPLFYIRTPEGIATLAAAMAGAVTMTIINERLGFVRLMGIGHIYWIPQVIWFWFRLDLASPGSLFQYWMWSIIVLNSVSILIDLIDIIKYIQGERAPYVT